MEHICVRDGEEPGSSKQFGRPSQLYLHVTYLPPQFIRVTFAKPRRRFSLPPRSLAPSLPQLGVSRSFFDLRCSQRRGGAAAAAAAPSRNVALSSRSPRDLVRDLGRERERGKEGRKGAWLVSCKKNHSSHASASRRNIRKNTDTVETKEKNRVLSAHLLHK